MREKRARERRPHETVSDPLVGRDDGGVNHRPKEDVMESAALVIALAGIDRPRPCPATIRAAHLATKGSATRLTRRQLRR